MHTYTHIHTHAPNEASQKRQCKRLLSHFGFSKQMHVKPTNFKAAPIGSLLLETTTDIKQNRRDDLTSFCFHFFQHAWKDKWSTNQYFPLQTLYWLKSSMLHFILYCCIIAQQMTRQMTLHISVPGRWQDELTFYHLWGKKNVWNLKSLHKSCTLYGLLKIIKIPGRDRFKAVKHEELPIKTQLLWLSEDLLILYELHKNTLLTRFDK